MKRINYRLVLKRFTLAIAAVRLLKEIIVLLNVAFNYFHQVVIEKLTCYE